MILINLLVPYDRRDEIDMKEGPDFKIISSNKHRKNLSRFFNIETTEEEYLFLKLKYGNDRVWKR